MQTYKIILEITRNNPRFLKFKKCSIMNDYERISKVLEYLKLNASALSRKLGLKNPQVFL